MHHYCDEIKAGSDVTQTDPALALRRRFAPANIGAFNERLQIRREAQRKSKGLRAFAQSRLTAGLGALWNIDACVELDESFRKVDTPP